MCWVPPVHQPSPAAGRPAPPAPAARAGTRPACACGRPPRPPAARAAPRSAAGGRCPRSPLESPSRVDFPMTSSAVDGWGLMLVAFYSVRDRKCACK